MLKTNTLVCVALDTVGKKKRFITLTKQFQLSAVAIEKGGGVLKERERKKGLNKKRLARQHPATQRKYHRCLIEVECSKHIS